MSLESLLTLQSLCGLSNTEAADLCGVQERAWNDFRAGAKAPKSWPDLLLPMAQLRDTMNDRINDAVALFKKLTAEHAFASPPVFLLYMRDKDMVEGEAWPYAGVQRRVTAETIEALDVEVRPVVFDAAQYRRWLDGRPDTRAERITWATEQVDQPKYRLGIKMAPSAVGWAAILLSKPTLKEFGEYRGADGNDE